MNISHKALHLLSFYPWRYLSSILSSCKQFNHLYISVYTGFLLPSDINSRVFFFVSFSLMCQCLIRATVELWMFEYIQMSNWINDFFGIINWSCKYQIFPRIFQCNFSFVWSTTMNEWASNMKLSHLKWDRIWRMTYNSIYFYFFCGRRIQ